MKKAAVLLSAFVLLCIFSPAFAQTATEKEEEITLSTYYPAPYGEYEKLVADTMVYTPRSGNPDNIADPKWPASASEGELAYSDTKDAFYYFNGSAWVLQGGGGSGIKQIQTGYLLNPTAIPATNTVTLSAPYPAKGKTQIILKGTGRFVYGTIALMGGTYYSTTDEPSIILIRYSLDGKSITGFDVTPTVPAGGYLAAPAVAVTGVSDAEAGANVRFELGAANKGIVNWTVIEYN